ncbi:MAG: branched-chain amino acid ABC transporter permease [Planctomycetes bacterium]|nr:branched-chain amino acid ABC transporter permease [Planctomycetota bacterium]
MSGFSQLLQFALTGVTVGSIYALVAIGFNAIYNATGIINFAQGQFVVLGGMLAVTLSVTARLPVLATAAIVIAAVGALGGFIEFGVIRRLRRPNVLQLIMVTVGLQILLEEGAMAIWGTDPAPPMPHFSGDAPIRIAGATILPQTVWILGTLAVVVAALAAFFRWTTLGKAVRACAANAAAARLAGIPVRRMVWLSFVLSAAIGAIGGLVITPMVGMEFDRGPSLALKGFGAAVLGGLGSFPGAVAGGMAIGILESLAAGYISSGYKDAVALAVLLAVLFVRPSGLFGGAAAGLREF